MYFDFRRKVFLGTTESNFTQLIRYLRYITRNINPFLLHGKVSCHYFLETFTVSFYLATSDNADDFSVSRFSLDYPTNSAEISKHLRKKARFLCEMRIFQMSEGGDGRKNKLEEYVPLVCVSIWRCDKKSSRK